MRISGIYKIQSRIKPERCYIGSAIYIHHRWTDHLRDLKKGTHHSKKLQNHYNKYGESDLQFSILLGCPKEDLIKTEQYFIDSYNPYFNICKIAGSMLGYKFSKEACKRNSETHKGLKRTDEVKKKMSESMKGKKKTPRDPKYAKKIGDLNRGKKVSKETRLKMSKSHIGKNTWQKGRRLSEETKKKISESHMGHKDRKLKQLRESCQN